MCRIMMSEARSSVEKPGSISRHPILRKSCHGYSPGTRGANASSTVKEFPYVSEGGLRKYRAATLEVWH